MKRIVSIFMICLLVLSTTSVFASTEDFWSIYSDQNAIKSCEYNVDFAMKLNEPLSKEIDPDGAITMFVDLMKFSLNGEISTSTNGEKTKMHLFFKFKSDVQNSPIGEDLKQNYEIWYDIDNSNKEKPAYNIIMKEAGSDKYEYFNTSDVEGIGDMNNEFYGIGASAELLTNKENKNAELNLLQGVLKNKVTPVYNNGTYKLIIDDKTVMEILMLALNVGDVSDVTVDVAKLQNLKIFDKDAIVIETTINDKKQLEKMTTSINVKTNLFELMNSLDSDKSGLNIGEGLSKQNSNINFTVGVECTYKKINEVIEVKLPVLTRKNSVNLFDPYSIYEGIDKNAVNIIINGDTLKFNQKPVLVDDFTMVPLREFCNQIGIEDQSIRYKNGKIEIIGQNGTADGVIYASLKVNSDKATVLEQNIELDRPVLVKDGRAYVPARFLAQAFHFDLEWEPISNSQNHAYTGSIILLETPNETPRKEYCLVFMPEDMNKESVDKIKKVAEDSDNVNHSVSLGSKDIYIQKVNVLLAAGEKSIIIDNDKIGDEMFNNFIEMNMFTPVNENISKLPALKELLEKNPDIKSKITFKDGNIYYIPIIKNGTIIGKIYIPTVISDDSSFEFINEIVDVVNK